MKFYRVKHVPTGLYYCPSRNVRVTNNEGRRVGVRSNLSKKGKVYDKDPRSHISSIQDHTNLKTTSKWPGVDSTYSPVKDGDLVLEQIKAL